MIIAGFALGQVFLYDRYFSAAVPGSSHQLEDIGLKVYVDDFQISRREDFSAIQYTASLRAEHAATGEVVTGQAQVNHPMAAFGYQLLQNATGWAVTCQDMRPESRSGSRCSIPGMRWAWGDTGISLQFNTLYPDYVRTREGPGTKSPCPTTPPRCSPCALRESWWT